jgi:hypothetical protein
MDQQLAPAFPTPALRKKREGRGTHFLADDGEIKSLGHPPDMECMTQQMG